MKKFILVLILMLFTTFVNSQDTITWKFIYNKNLGIYDRVINKIPVLGMAAGTLNLPSETMFPFISNISSVDTSKWKFIYNKNLGLYDRIINKVSILGMAAGTLNLSVEKSFSFYNGLDSTKLSKSDSTRFLPSYKVYTALLTQNLVSQTSGTLDSRHSYIISELNGVNGATSEIELVNPGTGYTESQNVPTAGGHGTGLTVSITVGTEGQIEDIRIGASDERGIGYSVGDTCLLQVGDASDGSFVITSILYQDNFTNVGFVSLNVPFIAAGTTPTVWTNGTVVTDLTASAPVATVLENTIGDIVWSYQGVGSYIGTLTNAFTENKTYLSFSSQLSGIYFINIVRNSISSINVTTKDNAPDPYDNILLNTPIEIRVYK
jgi:hypothetical protein